jgi:hypothetical protein
LRVRGTVIIAGSLAQRPHQGGHTWVFLQYLRGFRRLGWDVLFLDRLEPEMCTDAHGGQCELGDSIQLRYFLDVMQGFDLGDAFSLDYQSGQETIGMPRKAVLQKVRESACLINVMGFLTDDEILRSAPRRAFLDIDPGFPQMWQELGLSDLLSNDQLYLTIGLNVGESQCTVPTCGLNWIRTPQPIVLSDWPVQAQPAVPARFTSIASWRGDFGPVEFRGNVYGLRVHEFRKFVALPRRSQHVFEQALNIHPNEVKDLAMLAENGWTLVDPQMASGDPWVYQRYIQNSAAEFMVAKGMYVQTRGGWVSDRSICYLASGRPVLAQDTSLAEHFPTHRGLVTFSTLDEAADGADRIMADYPAHSRAARQLAEEYFDSDKVLARLLQKMGV